MLHFLLAAAAALAPNQQSTAAPPPQQVYVMRHLQKGAGSDPSLSKEGAAYAQMLAGQLGDSGIKAVFATPTRRATETGEPLAKLAGVTVRHYDPGNVPALVEAVNAVPGNVLVIGHSNTVPDLVAAFGAAKPASIPETAFGTIYLVTRGSPDVRLLQVPPPPVIALTPPERGR